MEVRRILLVMTLLLVVVPPLTVLVLSIASASAGLRLKQTELHAAARLGDVKKMKRLLDSGMDIDVLDSGGDPPLYTAFEHERWGAADFLLRHGASLSSPFTSGRSVFDTLMERRRQGALNWLKEWEARHPKRSLSN